MQTQGWIAFFIELEAGPSEIADMEDDYVLGQVAELPGQYGPITVTERAIQRLWSLQAIRSRDMRLRDGRELRVQHPGVWNRSGAGPDFKNAVLLVDGSELRCDVEIHLYLEDWGRHGHSGDTNFDGVGLHVVLFEPKRDSADANMPTLVLGPYLTEDVESCLIGVFETVELGQLFNHWAEMDVREIRGELWSHALDRWEQKLKFVRRRLELNGFEETIHQLTLEVLGYRKNRAPMSELALKYPSSAWRSGSVVSNDAFGSSKAKWVRGGQRPANRPEIRIQQYEQLWKKNGSWPEALVGLPWSTLSPDGPGDDGAYRRESDMPALQKLISETLVAGTIGGSRLDTLVIDAWLPVIAAMRDQDLSSTWLCWYAGDFPESFEKALKHHAVSNGRSIPRCNAWNQGVIQTLLKT